MSDILFTISVAFKFKEAVVTRRKIVGDFIFNLFNICAAFNLLDRPTKVMYLSSTFSVFFSRPVLS